MCIPAKGESIPLSEQLEVIEVILLYAVNVSPAGHRNLFDLAAYLNYAQ